MEKRVNCFYHGTDEDFELGLSNMLKILETGFIRSRNKLRKFQNVELGNAMFNGEDYISVCAWDESVNHEPYSLETSFNGWVCGCPFFVISNDIAAIHCELFDYKGHYDAAVERVSQFKDEWHVKDEISIENILGIALPIATIKSDIESGFLGQEYVEILNKIIIFAREHNWFIFEQSSPEVITTIEEYMTNLNKCHKK